MGAGLAPVGPEEIHRAKLASRRAGDGAGLPSNVEWVRSLPAADRARYGGRVLRRPSRTLSGVAIVAVMTAPARCPHGRCTYCPGGVENASPQSYTGEEPSALRGAQFHWDSFEIAAHRLATLEAIGHPTSKVEVIVMGGTFPARPRAYQEEVLHGIYDALNGRRTAALDEALAHNETAEHRMVGLTVETRPDWCDARTLPFLQAAGVTRVELGVECLDEDVLTAVGRAHGTEEVRTATREARDRGLKVGYHMMLGLPGTDPGKDISGFRTLFEDPDLRPDFLKIYPTLVLPGTPLYEDWVAGRYRPYDTETAVEVLARIKSDLPPWVRIQRIQRDIPSRLIAAGVRASNLRELAVRRMESQGRRCRCLRCREPGRRPLTSPSAFELVVREYAAAHGREVFLAFEDATTDSVAGYLRLRLPGRPTVGPGEPIVRELKVLGLELPLGATGTSDLQLQHRGFGRRLLAAAEERARSEGYDRIHVTSAVGTREYYRRWGFAPSGPLMAKPLPASSR